jgi:hypothetical protein
MHKKPATLKDLIAPEHLLQAIDNSLQHSCETSHGVTGLSFKRYTIIVHKKIGLKWFIECRSRGQDADLSLQPAKHSRKRSLPTKRRP